MMTERRTRAKWESQCDRAYRDAVDAGRDWAEVPLTRGKTTKVDLTDLAHVVEAGPWHVVRGESGWRAAHNVWDGDRQTLEHLPRYLLQARDGEQVDHKNHDSLDNRRDNLRVCSPSKNQGNRRKITEGSSRFKGVSWDRGHGRWHAGIRRQGRTRHLGYFDVEEEAALAYNEAARAAWGEFAYVNKIG